MNFLNRITERMKKNKKFEFLIYGMLVLLGVLIYVSFVSGSGAIKTESVQGNNNITLTQTELKLEEILSKISGAGRVKVMISASIDVGGIETIRGVIVTASGANDLSVRLKLQDAVCTVLGLSADMVEIFEMSKE